jgi:dihydrofolate reductase
MNGVDAIIMGKNTFEKIDSFNVWPYQKPVFVLSNSLKTIPIGFENKVELISGNIKEILSKIHNKGFKNLYIDGGKLIQSFLKYNLIDEMIITTIPTLVGHGIPLFGHLDNYMKFKIINSEFLLNQMVKIHYIIKKD